MKRVKKFLKWLLISILLLIAAGVAYILWWPYTERDPMDFVPSDAVFVIESADPIDDWESFSATKLWKHLKKNEAMADIQEAADYLDTLILDNRTLLGLLSGRPLVISSHMIADDDYDFLYLIDLGKAGKVSTFIDIFKGILRGVGIPISTTELVFRKVKKEGAAQEPEKKEIYVMGEGADAIYMFFEGNVLAVSYNKNILAKAMTQFPKPYFPRNGRFVNLKKRTGSSGQARLYLNFDQLDDYMRVFMSPVSETVRSLSKQLEFSTFDLSVDDDHAEMKGYLSTNEDEPSIMNLMRKVRGNEILAPRILPSTTSFFMAIDFSTFSDYFAIIEENMKKDKEGFADYQKTRSKIEKFLKIDFQEHLFNWIGTEITIGMMPVNLQGSKQAYMGVFHAPRLEEARTGLGHIVKRIKRRTPVKFKKDDYRGYDVQYMEMKGFFRLFLGKLFKKFDKPHFISLDNFVVFSNDTTALHRVIDHYEEGNTLAESKSYQSFARRFSPVSNYFIYLNGANFYPYLPTMGDAETARSIRKNRKYITCFPQLGFQLNEDDPVYNAYFYTEFDPNVR